MSPGYLHSQKKVTEIQTEKQMTPDGNSDQHKEMKNAALVNV